MSWNEIGFISKLFFSPNAGTLVPMTTAPASGGTAAGGTGTLATATTTMSAATTATTAATTTATTGSH